MQNNKNLNKKRRKPFWRGWRYDAAEHFNVSVSAISKYYNENKYDLIVWLEKQLKDREDKLNKAKQIKQEIETKYINETPEDDVL